MSDLTDEEIIATRRLHGLDDGLYKEDKKRKMTNKELKEKIANMPEDKYIYQRCEGRIKEYLETEKYYINFETGIATRKSEMILLGKVSENLIDLIEVGDYVNGYKVVGKEGTLLYTEIEGIDRSGYHIPISQYGEGIQTILTHELYEKNCYRVGGEE